MIPVRFIDAYDPEPDDELDDARWEERQEPVPFTALRTVRVDGWEMLAETAATREEGP